MNTTAEKNSCEAWAAESGRASATNASGAASGTADHCRTGVFLGSFDPFTIGHASIVRRALTLLDRVVVGVGINEQKACEASAEERVVAIAAVYHNEPRVVVKAFSGLAADFAQAEHAACIVKGVRSVKDFEYEREQADINCQLTGVETILLFAEPQYASLSSSVVRLLRGLGKDVSDYLP